MALQNSYQRVCVISPKILLHNLAYRGSYAADICDDNNIHQATEAKMDVASLLKTLSDPERIVTLLFYLEDIPIKKICKITSMPEGTVKSHLSRARVHMAKILKTK